MLGDTGPDRSTKRREIFEHAPMTCREEDLARVPVTRGRSTGASKNNYCRRAVVSVTPTWHTSGCGESMGHLWRKRESIGESSMSPEGNTSTTASKKISGSDRVSVVVENRDLVGNRAHELRNLGVHAESRCDLAAESTDRPPGPCLYLSSTSHETPIRVFNATYPVGKSLLACHNLVHCPSKKFSLFEEVAHPFSSWNWRYSLK